MDIGLLVKFKLTLTVVVTSQLGYLVAAGSSMQWTVLALLTIGGFLVAGAANALNQVLEIDFDKLMDRTKNRPLAANRRKSSDAVLLAGLMSVVGITLLALINPLSALLGMISLISYSFIYTPMKRVSTLAVGLGAIPGALPVLIGCTAHSALLTTLGLSLFALQFLWQFPHFWAIGFLAFDDYKKAGFKLLPMKDGMIDRRIGLSSSVYAALLVVICVMMIFMGVGSVIGASIGVILSIVYLIVSVKFYIGHDRATARALMFSSFAYMPLLLIGFWIF